MARGRHVKRSKLMTWLWPQRGRYAVPSPPGPDDGALLALQAEVGRLRVLGIAHAAAAASADMRARRAEEHLDALRAQVAALSEEVTLTRTQLVAVREELLWAFAEGRLPVAPATERTTVVDLRATGSRTA